MSLHIDQYKNQTGKYCHSNLGIETECPFEFIQLAILGFCGCGEPSGNLDYVRIGLKLLQEATELEREDYAKERSRIFGTNGSVNFFYYWADKEELTEHGGCLPGWLSPKGKVLLEDLEKLFRKER